MLKNVKLKGTTSNTCASLGKGQYSVRVRDSASKVIETECIYDAYIY